MSYYVSQPILPPLTSLLILIVSKCNFDSKGCIYLNFMFIYKYIEHLLKINPSELQTLCG